MTDSATATNHDLVIERVINATPDKLFRAWTEPALLRQWFCPKPWQVTVAETDARAGGSSLIVMHGPNGEEMPNRGVYLEVVKDRRIVATDAYTTAWEPSEKPFMTVIVTFEPLADGQTKYTACARHWTAEDKQTHVEMGFHKGWGLATNQLEELVARM
ncbi:MAG: SRPBCC family protein [Gammaproteobacteria bacterium]